MFTGTGFAAEGRSIGDLHTVTNARGGVVRSPSTTGIQVLESIDPNGVSTTYSYDQRLRLRTTTSNNQSTLYDYDMVGQLKRVTLPDQSWIGYDYDDAHRQVAVSDHKGNRVDYVLDNAGNHIGESVRDPEGNLKRQLSRSIDARGQIQQVTGSSCGVRSCIPTFPAGRIKTITLDNWTKFHGYKSVQDRFGVKFFFATLYHSWERGTNENTNGLIRQYLPKGMCMKDLTQVQCNWIANELNNRPRERLGF